MNDNAFDSLPPVPDDLWPKAFSLSHAAHSLASEVFPGSLQDVAGILGRGVHLEMQSSGEYAAKAVTPPANLPPHQAHLRGVELRFHARRHAEGAARLLHLYEAVHKDAVQQGASSLPFPAQLKEAATRTYRMALRDEMSVQQQIQALKGDQPGFNDELYSHLIKKAPGEQPKFHR